jgi:O-antigen ligase
MSESSRALIVLLFIATVFFALAKQPVSALMGRDNFVRRRNIWFALTGAAFLSNSFWLYTIIAMPLLLYAYQRETNVPALFFFILFVLPLATVQVPGPGDINYLFELSHARIIALLILLPALFSWTRQGQGFHFGQTRPDKLLAAYLLLNVLMCLRETSATDTFRQAFYLFIDVFLPYFVISRKLTDLQTFKDTLLSFMLASTLMAFVAIVEISKHWLLYQPLINSLDLAGMLHYLGRDGMLRAIASAGHPIALGYLLVTGMGCYLFVQHALPGKTFRRFCLLLLIAGLIAALSRGPWVGAIALLAIFIGTGKRPARQLAALGLAALLALPLLNMLPGGERVVNLLPFIGTTEEENISYRENLLVNSIQVIQLNPWFGSVNYMETPKMEAMRQGQGIIDIVNSYVGVTLEYGLVGLALFVGFFTSTLTGIFLAMRSVQDRNSGAYLLGRALLATLLAILIIIFTVSSITFIPIVYWSVAAMGVAYAQMLKNTPSNNAPRAPS